MAGPWFAVLEDESDWQHLDSVWIADGERDAKVELEIRVRLEDAHDETQHNYETKHDDEQDD